MPQKLIPLLQIAAVSESYDWDVLAVVSFVISGVPYSTAF